MELAETEEERVKRFMEATCGCTLSRGGPCSQKFTTQDVLTVRMDALDLSHTELDMTLLGQLMAFTNLSDGVVVSSKHKTAERKRSYTTFLHQGQPVCSSMFRFLHAVGEFQYTSIFDQPKVKSLTLTKRE